MFVYQHALVPVRYFSPSWAWQVGLSPTDLSPFLTNTFLHGGFLHIILNMWTLWIFGPALEDRLGPIRFAFLYLLAGVAASATHAVFNAGSTMPVLGASGAIAGIISAYAVRFPYAWVRVLVLIVFIPLFFSVPAMVFAGIWFFTQVVQGASELFSPLQEGASPGGRTSAASSPGGSCCAGLSHRRGPQCATMVALGGSACSHAPSSRSQGRLRNEPANAVVRCKVFVRSFAPSAS